jgi:hypothetical protein
MNLSFGFMPKDWLGNFFDLTYVELIRTGDTCRPVAIFIGVNIPTIAIRENYRRPQAPTNLGAVTER